MWNCAMILFALVLTASAVSTGDPNKSPLYPRSVKSPDGSGNIGSPADWTMSKANLVAEFYSTEPAPLKPHPPPNVRDRSHKSIFSFFKNPIAPPENNPNPSDGHNKHINGNINLLASGTSFNQQALPAPSTGGYATPFRPIKFPQQNYITPPNQPESGYLPNIRPRGPPLQQQAYWNGNGSPDNQPQAPPFTNGLRPPNPPSQAYLPPRGVSQRLPPPPQPPSQPALNLPNVQGNSPPPQVSYPVSDKNNSTFVPSQYVPSPDQKLQIPQPQYQSGPLQISDTYRKQAVYPMYAGQQTEKPLVYVMANTSAPGGNIPNNGFNVRPSDSYTNYENNPVPPPAPLTQIQQPNLNALSTESLSHVLAEANTKAGEAMDKTIRFVIHKPEDEDIVKNAILEDAQNRYEDVKFVQGPTLKVQRKETVYLPPKRKTVVYILLKEPQIDTDVQVMSPHEDEAAPEVYISYQKSDGAVKTKHYSPKQIREEDMKKYLDIEAESYSGAESQLHPRFSKTTTVSMSTSSSVSKKSANSTSPLSPKDEISSRELQNHKLSADDTLPLQSPLVASNSSSIIRPKKAISPPQGPPSARRFLRYPIQCPTTA